MGYSVRVMVMGMGKSRWVQGVNDFLSQEYESFDACVSSCLLYNRQTW